MKEIRFRRNSKKEAAWGKISTSGWGLTIRWGGVNQGTLRGVDREDRDSRWALHLNRGGSGRQDVANQKSKRLRKSGEGGREELKAYSWMVFWEKRRS